MALSDWSTMAINNANADPSINWREGQAPSTVNDSARNMMAALKTWFDQSYATFQTKAAVEAADIPSAVNTIQTLAYSATGDNGGATYARAGSEPSHNGKIQSDDGAWWEITGTKFPIEAFGADCGGTVVDTEAVQDAIDRAKATRGTAVISGTPRIDDTIDLWHDEIYGIEWTPGADVLVDLVGADEVAFKATHPTVPSTRHAGLKLYNPQMSFHPNVAASDIGAVMFEMRYASGLKVIGDGRILHYRNNTAVRISGAFNCNLGPWSIWAGGVHFPRKDTTGITFSIASGTNVLMSSASHFEASDVGKSIMLDGTPDEIFTIATYVDVDEVTTTRNAQQAFVTDDGVWDGVTGSINSASDQLTLAKDVLTADDVGRVVWVLGAFSLGGGVTCPLRTTIEAVSGVTTTLADAATASVTDAYVLFSPGVEIYGEDTSNNIVNDLLWQDFHIEQFRGCGLAMMHAVDLDMKRAKLHAQNDVFDETASTFNAVIANCYGTMDAIVEGVCANKLGRIHFSGQRADFLMPSWQGIGTNGQHLAYAEGNHGSGSVSIGTRILVNVAGIPVNTDPFRWVGAGVGFITFGRQSLLTSGAEPADGNFSYRGSGFQNTIVPVRQSGHINSGTPANGIGIVEDFWISTAAGNIERVARIGVQMVDVADASEDADFIVLLMTAGGAASEAFRIKSTHILQMGGVQLISTRKTGWAQPTGTATRDTFATGSVTLPQLAERVKALIDDLHAGAGGHGLIGLA